MTVYVDDMRAPVGSHILCHMIADTDAELHAMADMIGMPRQWHQGDHYDIPLSIRALAVAAGAREITFRQCGAMACYRRWTGQPLPSPEDAVATAISWQLKRQAEPSHNDVPSSPHGSVERRS